MEYRNKISKAREKLDGAKDEILNAYLSAVEEKYKGLSADEQETFLEKLDEILEHDIKSPFFDRSLARKIRTDLGISQKDLAEQLTSDPKDQQAVSVAISRYETQRKKLDRSLKMGAPIKYLGWLKEHGYNPFNL